MLLAKKFIARAHLYPACTERWRERCPVGACAHYIAGERVFYIFPGSEIMPMVLTKKERRRSSATELWREDPPRGPVLCRGNASVSILPGTSPAQKSRCCGQVPTTRVIRIIAQPATFGLSKSKTCVRPCFLRKTFFNRFPFMLKHNMNSKRP